MGIFGKLFGSEKAVEKIADGIYNGIDKLVYTDEEKAQMRIEAAKHFVQLLRAYEPFKIAQRLLALLVVGPYVLLWLVSAGLFVWGGVIDNDTIIEISKELAKANNDTLGIPVSLVLGFYFGGGMAEGILSKLRSKDV